MVWSDQSQFPFYVIDNNGNIIFTIDETGAHLTGQDTGINLTLDGSGAPPPAIIEFTDRSGNNADSAVIDAQRNPFLNDMSLQIQSGTSATAGFSFLFLDGDKAVLEYDRTAAPASTHRLTIDRHGVHIDGDDWQDLILQNGWHQPGAAWQVPQARISPTGAVEFKGTISAGTLTDGTLMFDLPSVDMRPTTVQMFAVGVSPSGGGAGNGARLYNDGTNNDHFYIYGVNAGGTDAVMLSGCSYYP